MSKIIGIHTPSELKNLVINGAFDFWQEKVGNGTTINSNGTSFAYSSDMFKFYSQGPSTKNYSVNRSTDVPTVAQSGMQSTYSNLFTMITGIPTFAATDIVYPYLYIMEGLDYSKIHAKTVTVGFWVKASIAGTYTFTMQNSANNRSYVTTFAVNSANTHEFKSITIQMDNSGTWLFDNSVGLYFFIGACTGSTYQTSNLNAWQAGNFLMASSATNYMGTSGATIRVSQISMVEGSLGFGATGFQRAGKTVQQELAMCQRYYEKSCPADFLPFTATATGCLVTYNAGSILRTHRSFQVHKRANPTMSGFGTDGVSGRMNNESGGTSSSFTLGEAGGNGFTWTDGNVNGVSAWRVNWIADARL